MADKMIAIVLAAGRGKRMNSDIQKQYLLIEGKPVIYYSLKTFEESVVDEIILVVGKDEVEYCQKEIVEKYNFSKITHIVQGGTERYYSVYNGLCKIDHGDYVLIHDGARPFVNEDMINRSIIAVKEFNGCTVAMPVKDTIKIVDENQFGVETPERKLVWQVQTPQSFKVELIKSAYAKMLQNISADITDDTMIVERYEACKIKVIEGSYENIKITTPEDLKIAEIFLKKLLTH